MKHEKNGICVDTSDFGACFLALKRLILDVDLRERIIKQAIKDAVKYDAFWSAFNILNYIFDEK